jgi:hypothetical protein
MITSMALSARLAIFWLVLATILVLSNSVDAASGAVSGPSSAHPGWIQVPSGALVSPDCVHSVPNGAHIAANGDVSLNGSHVAHYDRCSEQPAARTKLPPPPGSTGGWVEDWDENTIDDIKQFIRAMDSAHTTCLARWAHLPV